MVEVCDLKPGQFLNLYLTTSSPVGGGLRPPSWSPNLADCQPLQSLPVCLTSEYPMNLWDTLFGEKVKLAAKPNLLSARRV